MSLPRRPAPATGALTAADWALLAGITALGAALRLAHLGFPSRIMFDEVYYARDACWYVEASSTLCKVDSEVTGVHPPLGKWLIALGIRVLGYDAVGWRIVPALFGIATVALTYAVARKLLRSTPGAALASFLLAIDLLHIAQSRIAMLDVFVPAFGMAALLFTLLDRDRLAGAGPDAGGLRARPWRLAAGLACGAAVASKWSGVLFLALVVALTLAWERAARRRAGVTRPGLTALREEGPAVAALLVVAPAALYALTYVGRIDGSLLAAPWQEGSWARAFVQKQIDAASFHLGLEATHPYQSPPLTWIALKRPVSYFFCSGGQGSCPGTPEGSVREIMAVGSPFVWWASVAALAWAALRWVRGANMLAPEGTILAGFAFNYLPWVALSRGRGAVFLFYLLPALPFMCMALGLAAQRLGRTWEARAATAMFVGGAVATFWFLYPLVAGTPLTRAQWEARILFDDCARPTATPEKGAGATSATDSSQRPPRGWCWI